MLCYAVLAFSLILLSSADPKFDTSINPGCPLNLCPNGTKLVYSRLQSDNSSLHVFVAIGKGLGEVTVSYVKSADPKQNVTIEWEKLLSNNASERATALVFSNPGAPVLAKFSLLLSTLIEYSDTSDSVNPRSLPQNATYFAMYPFSSFAWQVSQDPKQLDSGVTWIVLMANSSATQNPVGYSYSDLDLSLPLEPAAEAPASAQLFGSGTGFLQLSIQLSPMANLRAADLPHLEFTGENTQLELLMKNLTTSLPNARFAVEAALLDLADGTDARQQTISETKSVDDEYTPGIFRVTNWQSGTACYAQWKPVAYKADTRSIGYSTVAAHSDLVPSVNVSLRLAGIVNDSFAYALFYGGDILGRARATALNVTFGLSEDKFYADSQHMLWTVSVGLGVPPLDKVSTLVIVVILCGLGIPAFLMVIAAVYLVVRRIRSGSGDAVSSYEPINA